MTEKQRLIMLVDDDPDYLFQMRFQLEHMGFQVETAESQREAESLMERIQPDLAIFDLMMEQEDSGFILSYKMKRKHPNVPIIIATAVSAETGMSFGLNTEAEKQWIKADLYLEKGISKEQLQKAINKLLKL